VNFTYFFYALNTPKITVFKLTIIYIALNLTKITWFESVQMWFESVQMWFESVQKKITNRLYQRL
jgi:hypothetical protein